MRILATVLVALLCGAASFGFFWLRSRIDQRASERHRKSEATDQPSAETTPLVAAAIACLAVFILVNVLDWPGGLLAGFWADHAIVAATASTLPLVGVGYFAFEAYDARVQNDLDSAVAATGRSGVVDHLVDIDVALALLIEPTVEDPNGWPRLDQPTRPLRWLRNGRERLGEIDGVISQADPRAAVMAGDVDPAEWRRELIDQCVRRIMAGVRDWGPVISCSRDGRQDLVELGKIRIHLLGLTDTRKMIDAAEGGKLIDGSSVTSVQLRCRELAWRFDGGRRDTARSEVLTPLGEASPKKGETDGVD